MNSERAQAYGRVMRTLADLGPAKLHDHEQDAIREAADTVLFAEDASASETIRRVDQLLGRLVDADRLLEETADRLVRDLEDAGPEAALA